MRSPTRTARRTWRVAVVEGSISRSPGRAGRNDTSLFALLSEAIT